MPRQKTLYDLTEIRAIPILDVCDYLGLAVEKRGRNYWCKVRAEEKASCILHPENNYFYDFGNGMHGSNIDLVCYARGGIGEGKAIRELAKAFALKPSVSQKERYSGPMTTWDYQRLGLHSDMATKNLIFPVTSASIEELLEMEHAYRMPMNELRRIDPDAYQKILETKAIPHVEYKRNCFYLSVWRHYSFLRMFHREVLFFDSERTAARFEAEARDLLRTERSLYKACQGTALSIPEPMLPDPQRVLSHLLQGRLDIPLGPISQESLKTKAGLAKEATYTREISYGDYCAAETDDHIHAATLHAGSITLSFPESERAFFEQTFPTRTTQNRSLETLLLNAEGRKRIKASARQEKELQTVR